MERIDEFLEERKENNLLRVLKPADSRGDGSIYINDKKYIDFSSNDYLGLSTHPKLKKVSSEALQEFGTSSCASRLLSGDSELCHSLEERIAKFKGKEAALIFNSGYQANVGIISALCEKRDVIFSDKLNHASIIDGMILSGARFFRFQHGNFCHLESLLEKHRHNFRNSLIITESIFSMDGDRAPLKELVGLKESYNCKIMVDEAHATGIFGQKGGGVIEEENLTSQIDIIMGTFGKALGSFGAYVASSLQLKKYLINTSRSFIYSTALPPAVIAANLASLDLIEKESYRRKTLLEMADYFRRELKRYGFMVKGSSQIVPLMVKDSQKALAISQELQNKGYWVLAIRPPTVASGEARLRFSLMYNHTKNTLERLINDICKTSCIRYARKCS